MAKNTRNLFELLFDAINAMKKGPCQCYSRRNNVEISGILHEILDNNLEGKVIDICKDAGIKIDHMDIESCHRLLLIRNNSGGTKRVIVKFVNRKHPEDMVWLKKIISSRSKAFVSNSL